MKKTIALISLLGLCACATTTDNGNGLTMLTQEPENCEFLYTLDSVSTTYKIEDAYAYIEKSIIENQMFFGDSYLIVDENVTENPGAVFGPGNTFKFKVKVYKCNK